MATSIAVAIAFPVILIKEIKSINFCITKAMHSNHKIGQILQCIFKYEHFLWSLPTAMKYKAAMKHKAMKYKAMKYKAAFHASVK